MNYGVAENEYLSSWKRCKQYGLTGKEEKPLKVIKPKFLQMLLQKNKVMISLFLKSIKVFKNQLADNYSFYLIDSEGLIVAQLEQENQFVLGTSLKEKSCGTNSVSLAMELNRPIYLLTKQHYCQFLFKRYHFALPVNLEKIDPGYLVVANKLPLHKETIIIGLLLRDQINLIYNQVSVRVTNQKAKVKLTNKEIIILKLLANGLTEKQVGKKLFLSNNTIKYHKKKIFQELNVNSTIQAIYKAVQSGLLSD